jgi:hypothetical protein
MLHQLAAGNGGDLSDLKGRILESGHDHAEHNDDTCTDIRANRGGPEAFIQALQ